MTISLFIPMLIYASFMGSITAGIILLMKAVLRNRLGAGWQYIIWLPLVLKLSFPFAPESPFSVFNLLKFFSIPLWGSKSPAPKDPALVIQNSNSISKAVHNAHQANEDVWNITGSSHMDLIKILFFIWLTVAVLFLAHTMLINFRTYRHFRNRMPVENKEIVQLFENCKKQLHIRKQIDLATMSHIHSPVLYGVFKPALILPTDIENKIGIDKLEYVFLHELSHYKRKDIPIRWLICILQIVYWFNPINWIVCKRIRQDMELACDAYVLKILHTERHKAYAATIISFLDAFPGFSRSVSIAGIFGSYGHMKKRIVAITRFKRETRAGVMLRTFIILIITGILITNGQGTVSALTRGQGVKLPQNYEKINLKAYFNHDVGTFVLYDVNKSQYAVYNEKEAVRRESPCSTFKVIEALMGLETGVLDHKNTTFLWDGTQYPYDAWNQDQDLASAMRNSVEWYFQEVSAKVGKKNTKEFVKAIHYGNNDVSGDLKEFWIQSTLKISPLEQVEVWKNLYFGNMPFSQKNMDIVKEVTKLSENRDYTLYGKTGSGKTDDDRGIGWFVGYVISKGQPFIFASYVEGDTGTTGERAKNITMKILQDHFKLNGD